MRTSPVCVDASFLVRTVTSNDLAGDVEALMAGWLDQGRRLIAPTLLFYEVGNALHRYVLHGRQEVEEARDALDAAMSFDIELLADHALHKHSIEIARRFELPSVYDAHYLALSERFKAEFWTADAKLYRKIHSTLPWVHLLGS